MLKIFQFAASAHKVNSGCLQDLTGKCRAWGMDMQQDPDILTLFVYGTLMRASRAPFARRLAMESRFVGRASVNGILYSMGRYPGLVEAPGQKYQVHGEVVRLNTTRSFAWLDDYEGCGPNWPEPQEYQRKTLTIRLLRGDRIPCWVYIYRKNIMPSRWIPNGRFMPL